MDKATRAGATGQRESGWTGTAGYWLTGFFFACILLALFHGETEKEGYLFFHALVEVFSIVVACGIFMVAWHNRRFIDNPYFLLIGIAYLFVGILDFFHTISYEGMAVHLRAGPLVNPLGDPAIEFWIAARSLEALSLFAAVWFIARPFSAVRMLLLYMGITTLIFCSIYFWGNFPSCYVEGQGLTEFKKTCEYVIGGLMLITAAMLYRKRSDFPKETLVLLIGAALMTAVAEMIFTLYSGMFQNANIIGHYIKLLSFYMIYRATIQTGLEKPYALLFRNLKNEHDFIDAILDNEPALVAVTDPQHRIIRANRAAARLVGCAENELFERDFDSVFQMGEGHEDFWKTSEDGSSTEPFEITHTFADTAPRTIVWQVKTMNGHEAFPSYTILSGTDITEKRETEAALLRAGQMAAVGMLARGISHHFNNLHGGILGLLELVEQDPEIGDKNKKRLESMSGALRRAIGITRNMLSLSRDSASFAAPFAFAQVVQETVDVFEAFPENESVKIEKHIGDCGTLMGDPGEVGRAVMHLLTNAGHAVLGQKDRRIEVTTGREDVSAFVRVRDNGRGIPAENLPKVKLPMFTTKGEYAEAQSELIAIRGLGLGLTMVELCAHKYGGRLEIESVEGAGATITLWLATGGDSTPDRTDAPRP